MNEWWWMNERMSKGQMDGWKNFKWTNDVTWLNDSNQYGIYRKASWFLALLAMPHTPPKLISKRVNKSIKFIWATYFSFCQDLFDPQVFVLSREC